MRAFPAHLANVEDLLFERGINGLPWLRGFEPRARL
jgi:hypothetical protein